MESWSQAAIEWQRSSPLVKLPDVHLRSLEPGGPGIEVRDGTVAASFNLSDIIS